MCCHNNRHQSYENLRCKPLKVKIISNLLKLLYDIITTVEGKSSNHGFSLPEVNISCWFIPDETGVLDRSTCGRLYLS
jgi:hypothetical protein